MIMIVMILTGCLTVSKNNTQLEKPERPVLNNIKFEKVENGYFLSDEEVKNLGVNISRLETYIKILESIINGRE